MSNETVITVTEIIDEFQIRVIVFENLDHACDMFPVIEKYKDCVFLDVQRGHNILTDKGQKLNIKRCTVY